MGEIGLNLEYFYSLTYRQFSNIIKGYRNKEDLLSQERLIIMRKLMFASLLPHLKKGAKETDLLQFEFEKTTLEKLSNNDFKELEAEVEKQKQFWLEQDAKKNIC